LMKGAPPEVQARATAFAKERAGADAEKK